MSWVLLFQFSFRCLLSTFFFFNSKTNEGLDLDLQKWYQPTMQLSCKFIIDHPSRWQIDHLTNQTRLNKKVCCDLFFCFSLCHVWFISSVLYFSIHRYDHAQFFPFSTCANYDVVGTGAGKGFTVNVPWNKVMYFILHNNLWI